jgi:hypothetical protein
MSNDHVHPIFKPLLDAISQPDTPRALTLDPRDPDRSREGIFVYHNCYRCEHGKKPCVQGGSHRCDNPRARND